MNKQHKALSVERWREFSLCEQMANIGSEVLRALKWREKGNQDLSQKASARALELLDLSLDAADTFPRIREYARLREVVVDYFYGSNQFRSSNALWQGYFNHFNFAARKHR